MELKEIKLFNSLSINSLEGFSSSPSIIDSLPFEELLTEDLWSFGFFWHQVRQKFSTIELLYLAIQDLHDRIREIKESFRPFAHEFPDLSIELNKEAGISGSYWLIDPKGEKRFIVKPLDEDAGCLHSDGYATPFTMSPFRSNMPLYLSSMRDVLAFTVSQIIGAWGIVPETVFGILESDRFHDFSQNVSPEEVKRYFEICAPVDLEKLCSVQEYVPNSKTLFEALQDLQAAGLSDEEIAARFDQTDFENANLLLWTTYDTDGHPGNFLVYAKGIDDVGNEILGLKKIDNSLAFPDKNRQLRNNLSFMPNAKQALSEEAKRKIASIDVDRLASEFEKMGLESAIPALRDRMALLKELGEKPGITLRQINQAMSKMRNDYETDIIYSS